MTCSPSQFRTLFSPLQAAGESVKTEAGTILANPVRLEPVWSVRRAMRITALAIINRLTCGKLLTAHAGVAGSAVLWS